MPALGQENTANIVNVIWLFAAVVPWALISLRERPRDVVGRSCVAFLAATSTALSVIFLPLAIGAAWLRATRAIWVVVTAFVVGLVLQSAVVFNQTVWPHSAPSRLATLGYLIAVRVCAMFLIGPDGIAALWADHSHLLVFAAPSVVVLIFVLLFPGAGRRSQAIALVFLAYALISFLFTALGRGTDFVAWAPGRSVHPDAALPYNFTHIRFSVIPVMMLLSAAVVLIAPTDRGFYRTAGWIARPLFIIYIIAVTATGFFVTNGRSAGPSWSKATALAYAGQCFGAPPEKIVEVRTFAGDFFNVRMTCRDVLQARTSGPTSW
jgi:hypothetical protein